MDNNEENVIISMRRSVSDVIVPGSEETTCSECGEGTYTSPSGMAMVKDGARVLCDQCFFQNIDNYVNDNVGLAPGSDEEIRDFLRSEYERN